VRFGNKFYETQVCNLKIMSRIGKKIILIPENVEVKKDGQKIFIKGPKGEISRLVLPELKIEIEGRNLSVLPQKSSKNINALWGLTRALIANAVKGVSEGYEKKLELVGIGFKAVVDGNSLVLNVGFTHQVKVEAPEGIKFSVEKNLITVSGIDKEKVTQIASKIKKVQPPEPYKGKGIKYQGEIIRRKEGKRAVSTAK